MTGAELIVQERARQVSQEGWDAKHDEEHCNGELVDAAMCYAENAAYHRSMGRNRRNPNGWPWDASWWKPKDPIRDLVRAGALIAAEIDRLQREETRAETPHGE